MVNILVLNGSPKGAKSNTYRITDAFLSGMKSGLGEAASLETIDVCGLHIEPCQGCFGCWTATPGKCVIRDDMDGVLPGIIKADFIIWSFPLYYYGMPSQLKALLDRNLPLNLPFLSDCSAGCRTRHPRRYARKPAENVLISTCGSHSITNNYEALVKHFDLLFDGNYTRILCPEGELFAHRELESKIEEYLSFANRAGKEYAQTKSISPATREMLNQPLYPAYTYAAMADASWDITEGLENPVETKERHAAERFTRQMAATYKPGSFDGTERIFEIYYTDVKRGFQLVMGKERCMVRTDNFTVFTTRVETPLTVWRDIANGVYSGGQAIMEGKYKTFGDQKFLMTWGHYFGAQSDLRNEAENKLKRDDHSEGCTR